ncbi:AMP-binding protein [Streptomyces sp. 4N509B]|uniref:AMP-binding protein n=1 Tax=Streptomyces sp. 4N509B TaxID=3457413 RepID=UPI003FD40604
MSPDDLDQGDGYAEERRHTGPADVLNHRQLQRQGEQAAEALSRLGVRDGDSVAVALPMCLESVVVTLACIRLGALRITLPVGDHLGFVRNRIRSSGARVVVTADASRTPMGLWDVKAGIDRALWGCPEVHTVIVVPQVPRPVPWEPGRDLWWHEALAFGGPGPDGVLGVGPYAGGMTTPPPERSLPDPLAAFDFDDPLDRPAADDTDRGWGDRPEEGTGGARDLARFLEERPPHHL